MADVEKEGRGSVPLPPPPAKLLMMAFWALLGAAAGIKFTRGVWQLLGWAAGGCPSPSRSEGSSGRSSGRSWV